MLENKVNLDETDLINSVVYFGALGWCAPCKKLHPMMEELATEITGLRFIYVDVDAADFEQVIKPQRILSVPTVKVFINGVEKESIMGLKSKAHYEGVFTRYTG